MTCCTRGQMHIARMCSLFRSACQSRTFITFHQARAGADSALFARSARPGYCHSVTANGEIIYVLIKSPHCLMQTDGRAISPTIIPTLYRYPLLCLQLSLCMNAFACGIMAAVHLLHFVTGRVGCIWFLRITFISIVSVSITLWSNVLNAHILISYPVYIYFIAFVEKTPREFLLDGLIIIYPAFEE